MKKLLFVTAGMFLSCSLLAQDEAAKIDSLILKNAGNAEFSGSVLVAKAGKIVLHKGYGYSHEEQKIPNDVHTVYCIASVTKTFTAALVLKLEEQGKLSVTDYINRYLPGFPNGEKITIHQLLTHTSGIPDYLRDKGFQSIDQSKPITQEEMMNFFKNKPLDFDPGTSFRNSNSGYTILGYIVEKVTGTSYADALANYIFKPLHMEHTTYGSPQGNRNKPATGYMMYYKNFKRTSPVVHTSVSYATGLFIVQLTICTNGTRRYRKRSFWQNDLSPLLIKRIKVIMGMVGLPTLYSAGSVCRTMEIFPVINQTSTGFRKSDIRERPKAEGKYKIQLHAKRLTENAQRENAKAFRVERLNLLLMSISKAL